MPRYVTLHPVVSSLILLLIGIHVTDAMVYITVAHLLATFNVTKAVENGSDITPEVAQTSGTVR